MITTASLLSNLLASNAANADIVDVALALAPFGHNDSREEAKDKRNSRKSILRLAIERSTPMSLENLDRLASTHCGGADQAWQLANDPSLLDYIASCLDGHGYNKRVVDIKLILRILSLSTVEQLQQADRSPHSISLALLNNSNKEKLGIEPFLALIHKQGFTMAQSRLPDGSPAILHARCSEAFDAFLASGGNPREDIKGKPLWDELRERSNSFGNDKSLAQSVDVWAKVNESGREADRDMNIYFSQLLRYRGYEKLKERKDWHDIQDTQGRSALMTACMGSGHAIKTFWSVKKAQAGAALVDHDGRGLWHAILMNGKDAPPGSAAYLAEHAPLSLDAQGRGLLPSIWSMHVEGKTSSEHDWLFGPNETARACSFAPNAYLWLACENSQMAVTFGHWLANESYLGSKSTNGYFSLARRVEILSTLAMKLDLASFANVPSSIAGALVFHLALLGNSIFPSHEVEARISGILSHGAHVTLTTERSDILNKLASVSSRSMIKHAFGAAEEHTELSVSLPETGGLTQGLGKKIRL